MFSEELNKLIEASLVDGVITDQERAVIRKRALLEGVDPDEVDLMLDAEIQKIRQKQQAAVAKVKKCPACGEIIPALTGVCPSCGHVINVKSKDNNELMDLMDAMENELKELKSDDFDYEKHLAEIDSLRRKAKTLYGDNKKVQFLLAEIDAELERYKAGKKQRGKRNTIILVGVVVFFIIIGFLTYNNSVTGPVSEARALHKELCAQIDSLGQPSAEKYEEQKFGLLKIVWTGDEGYGFFYKFGINSEVHDLRYSFLEKKRAYASQLNTLHKQVYGEDDPTREIEFPSFIDN